MALYKVSFLPHLLVLGMFILVSTVEHVNACTKECGNLGYGYAQVQKEVQKIQFVPIVALGYKGCNYYNAKETFICEGTSDPKNHNACPLYCDPQITYSKCPRLEGKTIIYPTGCTTCCTGYKDCYYFGQDGKFVCEGESIEPKGCTQECDPRVSYMTCPSSGFAKLNEVCVNCCTAGEGCKLYDHDGSLLYTEEPQSITNTT